MVYTFWHQIIEILGQSVLTLTVHTYSNQIFTCAANQNRLATCCMHGDDIDCMVRAHSLLR